MSQSYLPLVELTRGETVESIHFGAFAVVDSRGQILASHGDPQTAAFLRSSAKPFQALPFIQQGGQAAWDLSPREISVICASHSGTDAHAAVIAGIQSKIHVTESDLRCGVHEPGDKATAIALIRRGEQPTPLRHNCSGKHTGMLAFARMKALPIEDYLDPQHPIQKEILAAFSEMCQVEPARVALGTDGCSAPNFAVPLWNAALGFARLADPGQLAPARAVACQTITQAMTRHPDMVAGPGKFDTRLMTAAGGKIVCKGGAEGYQAIGIFPGVLAPGAPGVGIAIKISDGDLNGRARNLVTLEILRRLGALDPSELEALADLGPRYPLYNWRKLLVGEARPVF